MSIQEERTKNGRKEGSRVNTRRPNEGWMEGMKAKGGRKDERQEGMKGGKQKGRRTERK